MGTDITKESSFMGGKIKFAINKDYYFESQIIEGEIYLDINQNIIITDIKLSLKKIECFLYKETEKNISTEIKNEIIKEQNTYINQYLGIQSDKITLNQGSYKFPFKFTLPPNLHPSFEYPSQTKSAYIRYILIAELISPTIKALASKYILIKSRPIVIEHNIRNDDEKNIWSMGIIPRGSSRIAVFTVSNNYRINDIIPITVDVYNENSKNQVKYIKITFKRFITFIDKNKNRFHFFNTFYRDNYEVNVPAGKNKSFHFDIQLRDNELKGLSYDKEMNPYQNLNDLNLLLPTLKSSLISCEYTIKVTAYFSIFTPHNCRPRVELPLFISAQNIDDYKNEERQKEINNLKFNKSGFGNYDPINQGFNNRNNKTLISSNIGQSVNLNNSYNTNISDSQFSYGNNNPNEKSVVGNNNNNNNNTNYTYDMYRQKSIQNNKSNNNSDINNNNFENNNYGSNNFYNQSFNLNLDNQKYNNLNYNQNFGNP